MGVNGMRFGVSVPPFCENPETVVDLAREAEVMGWGGFFL
jgi:hypothetical protein